MIVFSKLTSEVWFISVVKQTSLPWLFDWIAVEAVLLINYAKILVMKLIVFLFLEHSGTDHTTSILMGGE